MRTSRCLAAGLILSVTCHKRGWGDVAMPEWLDRALFGILVAIAVLFFWRCIAGVMGAPSMLIWIGGIGVMAGIVSWTEEANNPSGRSLSGSARSRPRRLTVASPAALSFDPLSDLGCSSLSVSGGIGSIQKGDPRSQIRARGIIRKRLPTTATGCPGGRQTPREPRIRLPAMGGCTRSSTRIFSSAIDSDLPCASTVSCHSGN